MVHLNKIIIIILRYNLHIIIPPSPTAIERPIRRRFTAEVSVSLRQSRESTAEIFSDERSEGSGPKEKYRSYSQGHTV